MTDLLPLAYRPFLDPILVLNEYWFWLIIPLAFGIAAAYKAVRVLDLKIYPRDVAVFAVQIILGILALGIAALIIIEYLLPIIAPMPGA